jgi:crotonobetainyl-CoA:carnitine CoA-transferase CaiB-like acyl-CoA transferase
LGLDEASLQAVNPEVIFCQLDCFGGPRRGPRTDYLGYDDLIHATTGIMLRFGGGMDTPEEHAHVGTIDVMCGFAAALGVATALYRKHRSGEVLRARTSLAALGNLVQIPFCYDYEGRGPFDEPSGREAMGYSDLSRFYRTSDGWIYLDADESELDKFSAIAELAGVTSAGDRQSFLNDAISRMSSASLQERLQTANIAAASPDNIDSLRQRYSRDADGQPGVDKGSYSFSVYSDHPSGHEITQLDPYAIRPRVSRIRALPPAEKFGASTRKILQRVGYSAEQISSLLEVGAVSESWSDEYLPS